MSDTFETHIELPFSVGYYMESDDPSVGYKGGLYIEKYEINGIDLDDYRCGDFGLVSNYIQKLGNAILDKDWVSVDKRFMDVEREHKRLRIGPTLYDKILPELEEWEKTGLEEIEDHVEDMRGGI